MAKSKKPKSRKNNPYVPTYKSELEQADELDDYDGHEIDPTMKEIDPLLDDDFEYEAWVDYNNQGQFTGDYIPDDPPRESPALSCIAIIVAGTIGYILALIIAHYLFR